MAEKDKPSKDESSKDKPSKMPDIKEIGAMAGKLFKDIKTSIGGIIDDYKEKRKDVESVADEPKTEQKKAEENKTEKNKTEEKEKPLTDPPKTEGKQQKVDLNVEPAPATEESESKQSGNKKEDSNEK